LGFGVCFQQKLYPPGGLCREKLPKSPELPKTAKIENPTPLQHGGKEENGGTKAELKTEIAKIAGIASVESQ
jgi:hypothetical protein